MTRKIQNSNPAGVTRPASDGTGRSPKLRVYHFLSAKDAIDDLSKGRLKISTFTDMNDPFECLNCEMSNKEYEKTFNKLKMEMYERFGAICFSRNWSNTLLWSHYADKHNGICLGLDVPGDKLVEMDYISNKKALSDELERTFGRNQPNKAEELEILEKLLRSRYSKKVCK